MLSLAPTIFLLDIIEFAVKASEWIEYAIESKPSI